MHKTIEDFPNYTISSCGKVYSRYIPGGSQKTCDELTELTPVLDKSSGYWLVTLVNGKSRKNKRIHRLLAAAFIPNPEGKAHVNHKNGIKTDNSLSNLEWATPQENTRHAYDTGLASADSLRKAVLCFEKDKVTFVCEYSSAREAEKATGTAYQNISKVLRGLRHTAGGYHWKFKNV